MRKTVNLVGGHIEDSHQHGENQAMLRQKPIVEEIVIGGDLMMMSALMGGVL
jgi:hypothetical protein